MAADAHGVPIDNADFWLNYRPYVRGLVHKLGSGIPSQDVDDVVSEIMTRLMERDILGMYDPEKEIYREGKKIPATFRNFVSHMVSLYVRGQRDAISRRQKRELQIMDLPVGDDGSGSTWGEVFGGGECDDYSQLDAEELVRRMRAQIATVDRRSPRDGCSLVALYDECVRQILEAGQISYAALQERFRVSDTTISAWLGRLREIAAGNAEGMRDPRPEVAGVRFELADLRLSLERLRRVTGGNHMPRSGYPLAAHPDKRWYHQIAFEEIRRFPELNVIGKDGRGNAGHPRVRGAVIHYLERVLGIAAANAPAPVEPLIELTVRMP